MASVGVHQAAVVLANGFPSATARTGPVCHRGMLNPSKTVSAVTAFSAYRGLVRVSNDLSDCESVCSTSGSTSPAHGAPSGLGSRSRRLVCRASSSSPLQENEGSMHEVAATVPGLTRRDVLASSVGLAGLALSGLSVGKEAKAADVEDWEPVPLPVDRGVVLLDVGFVPDEPQRGYLVGTRQTLLETTDGGKTWDPRLIGEADEEGYNFRFNSVSFNGTEGWIVGKPAILLHSDDAGKNWTRIPLSTRLPGNPVLVKGTGPSSAEMVTDEGAIYVTSNKGYNWKAAVEETVSATLNRTVSSGIGGASYYTGTFSNINRSLDGSYVAVSSRGNFFLTWEPGQSFWVPHNRVSSRRIQNMGWRTDGGLWLVTRGGGLYLSQGEGVSENFKEARLSSRGFGILDVGFVSKDQAFAAGGSGILLKTQDGGKTWIRDKTADDIAANLYAVRFVNEKQGFVLGNNGVLLRYIGSGIASG
ncbi:hypothetical protein CBR_g11122 [Chara braunii]|uniref:Photosynthesis system II assembly factor Ycf48/Hcf136-like domain-containing protein n=1 Tax=Chara braunii TaxID=69332 RepID=A0A388KQ63_CHABU|nr:hypothetical protein CBR_g11122 [Chara braunii]|eukprot:GBG72189.1 hypothetical protein CBR_g11122 [Chara braunii]